MTTPSDITGSDEIPSGEAPSAAQTPAIIELSHLPPPEPAKPLRRNGRPVSTKPGSQVSRRRRVDNPKDRVITFRCTAAEHELFEMRAKAAGLAIGPYLRQRETGSAGPRSWRSPSEATKLLAQILGQMGKRGSNLNQATRALNEINLAANDGEGRDRLADRIGEMRELHQQAIYEHRECVAAIMRALGLRPDADHY